MIEIRLPLEGVTMGDLRRFMVLTEGQPDDWQPFLADYSIDHPAQLYAILGDDKES